jgi:UDP-N-acetylmuramyl pentapeptide phosphotransferase/UDP-N-acetylglucosamine-1-phosphate transferase
VRARYRFAAQFAAAFIAIASYGYWANGRLPIIGSIGILWLGVAVVWIVGLINAYNFMDGIDGIAGGVAVVAALWWIALFPKEPMWSIGVLLVAAALGFLLHNWSPARIFMGDVGSTFLGCMFAVLPLMLEVPVIGGLLMWPFLFDTGFTFLRRLLRREDIFSAHRDHLYQRLIISGWSHASVALLYIALTAVSGFFAWLWMQGVEPTAYFWLVGSAVGLLWLVHTQSAARQPAG